jgi:D-3-phosphoglycerate dehydrogenase / 2-oxoglutarate reductase
MPKVLIAPLALANLEGQHLQILRDAGFELVFPNLPHQLTEEELLALLPGTTAAIAGMEPYTPRVLAACPTLRVIARVGVGYDAVDIPATTARGVAVTIAPGTNQDSVAEHTFCFILGLTRCLVAKHNSMKAGRWERGITLPVRGSTLGIVGLGRIGKAVAIRGEAFGMRMLAYEPFPDNAFAAAHKIEFVALERLLAESDFVSLHLPLDAASRQMINKRTLRLMKKTAFLINTARGGLVNENDLAEALRAGTIAGAALDVFEREPPVDSPLPAVENVLLTPHEAGIDRKSLQDMALSASQAVVDLSHGKWPAEKIVNPAVKEKFRW